MALPTEWAWVEQLIADNGRTMTFTIPGSVADGAKPWRGNAAGTPTPAIGAFVKYKAKEVDGDHIKRGDQKILLIPNDTVNVEAATKVVDSLDSSSWNIKNVEKITSKSDIILYILQVRR
jgi:hypothetical protein